MVNLPPGGKVRLLKAEVQVMSRSQELIDFITENDPMVRHNLLDLFGSVNSDTIASRAGKEQLQADVKKRLEKVTDANRHGERSEGG
ncbi:MAG: flagellar basal body-associated FliL family protein [Candidatus Sedimenticola endophacoides]